MASFHVKNRGTGAGGYNTTKNGNSYENKTNLDDMMEVVKIEGYSDIIRFYNCDKLFIKTEKTNLFKYMDLKNKMNNKIYMGHGCKNPDGCFIDENNKHMFIIEKKFQQVSGSVCEKIQTPEFKLWQYSRTFPNYKIIYIYCLSDWFKYNCQAELEYLDFIKIPYFWGNSKTYKQDIIDFIVNYK